MDVTAQVHVDVADVNVVFHCDHAGDEAAYRIVADDSTVRVYLNGTPEQLGRFADAIVHAVSRHTIDTHARAITEALR